MKKTRNLFLILIFALAIYFFSGHVLFSQNKPSFEIAPEEPPTVDPAQTSVTPSSIFAGDILTISTNVTDVSGVASVSAYIVLSGSDVKKLTLTKTTGDIYKIDWQTPTDLAAATYTVDIESNDTLGFFERNIDLGTFTVNTSCSTDQCSAGGLCYDITQCHPTDVGKICSGSPAAWTGNCGDNTCQCNETATNCALDCGVVGCDNPSSPEVLFLDPSRDYPDPIGDLPSNANYTVMVKAITGFKFGIGKVDFYLDGLWQNTQTVACDFNANEWCWVFDTTGISGEHDIRAVAYVSSLAWCDDTRHINIQGDTQIPTANITDPLANATLSGTYGVKVHATDNVGVNKIEIYTMEGGFIGSMNVSPAAADTNQTINWDTIATGYPNGNYNLYALAYDADNNYGQAASVPLIIDNPCSPGQCTLWPNCYAAGACHPTTAVQKCDSAGSGNWVSSCGDASCLCSETNATCSTDCPPTVCGANGCEVGETCSNCPADCGLCPMI